MADEERIEVLEIEDIRVWVFFTMGSVSQAAFVQSGDAKRDERSRAAANNLHRLLRGIQAAFAVAQRHPDEFRRELGDPIALEVLK